MTSELESIEDDSEFEPVTSGHRYGRFQLVGHGDSKEYCGQFRDHYGCLRTELHNRMTLDGKRHVGEGFFVKVYYSCDKPSCPICYKKGWAVNEARRIAYRLKEGSKRFGRVEHVVASVPREDYDLEYGALRAKVRKMLQKRRVHGGVTIFHDFRYNRRRWWYRSPHWHVLGFVRGGYSQCRGCERKWNCLKGCGGFDDKSYQKFLKDGYHVKVVLDERETVFGTAWYQVNHATINVVSIFLCPICCLTSRMSLVLS